MTPKAQGLVYAGLFSGGIMWTGAAMVFVGWVALALGLAWVSGYCFAVAVREYVDETGVSP